MRKPSPSMPRKPCYGLARILSKRGVCSRTQAAEWVRGGRVAVGGAIVLNPEFRIRLDDDTITVDGLRADGQAPVYLMLNKPRGLVTTTRDEQGRDTVYRCFKGSTPDLAAMPWVAPVGRLDKASEGLLLFSNDPAWAARITDPERGPDKTYRVQVDCIPDEALLAALRSGRRVDNDLLRVVSVRRLQAGEKNAWLEIVLNEGRNRHIRRLLEAFDVRVLRLVRVAIGNLMLGDLAKGQWRRLNPDDLHKLG